MGNPRGLKGAAAVCASKRRFMNLAEAKDGAAAGLKPYQCPACGGFHLTSRGVREPGSDRDLEPEKPTFETSVLARAKGVRKSEVAEAVEVIAICQGKSRPDGSVTVIIAKKLKSTLPVQPAALRISLGAGVRVLVRVSGSAVRVLGLA